MLFKVKKESPFPSLKGPWGGADLRLLSPQPDTSQSCKTTDTGLMYRVVCPFTPQLSLVFINRPRRDGTLSWHWWAAVAGGNRTRDCERGRKSGTLPHGHCVPLCYLVNHFRKIIVDVCPIPSIDGLWLQFSLCIAYKNGQFIQTPINTAQ